MKNYTKKTIKFYNQYTEKDIKSGTIILKNKIDKFISLISGNKILDVACGPGHDTDYFTKKEINCLGIDLSEKMINFAKKNFQGKFRIMDFFNMKFRNNSFNGIWCSSAITHIDKNDLNKLLKNFRKILKKNGILGIIAPAKQKRKKKKNDTRIFTMFDKSELEKYLKDSNFKIIYSETFSCKKMKWIFIISKK
ncbi:MAG: class I SAM-dependent methyltransferase [Candidatus Nealsonbacteria bacterium]